jgi:hypothetical protein
VEPELDETPPPVVAEVVTEQAVAPEPAEPSVNFRNGMAVRTSFLAAAVIQLASTMSAAVGASLLLPVVLLAGGFYAVVLYARRTGSRLSVLNGARMGWITGIFCFVIMTVFFTVGIALLAGSDQLMKAYKDSAASLGLPPEAAQQFEKLASDPGAFAASIMLGLFFQFVFLTLFCSMGGALGAKLRGQKP